MSSAKTVVATRSALALSARVLLTLWLGAEATHAETLQPAPEASAWLHLGAAVLLYGHIAGGTIGLVSGLVASLTRKGGPAHKRSGQIFVVSMFVAYLIGAGVAPFLVDGQRPNFVAGVLALYLLVTGVMAAKRRRFRAGRAEYVGLGVALLITGMGVLFMVMGAQSPTGTVDGSPPQAFVVFVLAGGAAAAGELKVILKGSLSGKARTTRHLWRMCASFFFASGSLFMGQPGVFPDWFNESFLPVLLAFVPLIIMGVSIAKLQWPRRMRARA